MMYKIIKYKTRFGDEYFHSLSVSFMSDTIVRLNDVYGVKELSSLYELIGSVPRDKWETVDMPSTNSEIETVQEIGTIESFREKYPEYFL